MVTNRTTNRLIHEKSPYLLQHAHNPVDWYPWSEEAFKKAKREDKPVFLSIGYSTCHWCHVMERESFEDEEVGEILNKHFISIKVDREERPDIDSIYMSFCQALTGHGGWPLTIIMTPDKKPFFAGTYFPKKGRMGLPGLIEILNKIAYLWKKERETLLTSSNDIYSNIRNTLHRNQKGELKEDLVNYCYNSLLDNFDYIYGGFGAAPKFPTPHNLMFLLRYYKYKNEPKALSMVEKTLENMYRGGIYDHIGYGFSRYSTDHKWLVPHFEKMLYDNALLAITYLECYQVTGNDLYKKIAGEILSYILRDMTSPQGGFYSAEDADSEGEEGKFYVWTTQEILDILGEEDGKLICDFFNITEKGNFEGKNIPNLINTNLDKFNIEKIENLKEILFQYREKRVHPYKDDKILTAWNGLMIAAFSIGARVLRKKEYEEAAKKAVNFIMDNLYKERRLYARYREGETKYPAYVDDYAFLIWGLIELYETNYDPFYLSQALKLNNEMLEYFWDDSHGGLYLYGKDSEELILRPKEIYDGATPSGNSVATLNFLRLARLTGNTDLENKAHQQFQAFGGTIKEGPLAYTFFLSAYLFSIADSKEIVIVGEENDPNTLKYLEILNKNFQPFVVSLLYDTKTNNKDLVKLVPFVKDQKQKDQKTTVYICENFACQSPINDINKFRQAILN